MPVEDKWSSAESQLIFFSAPPPFPPPCLKASFTSYGEEIETPLVRWWQDWKGERRISQLDELKQYQPPSPRQKKKKKSVCVRTKRRKHLLHERAQLVSILIIKGGGVQLFKAEMCLKSWQWVDLRSWEGVGRIAGGDIGCRGEGGLCYKVYIRW